MIIGLRKPRRGKTHVIGKTPRRVVAGADRKHFPGRPDDPALAVWMNGAAPRADHNVALRREPVQECGERAEKDYGQRQVAPLAEAAQQIVRQRDDKALSLVVLNGGPRLIAWEFEERKVGRENIFPVILRCRLRPFDGLLLMPLMYSVSCTVEAVVTCFSSPRANAL